ncbi:hypothetical protein LENED_000076 [Lentinula edodes]|uniref:Uncharacterized protein n=1 Tax=Lentinula edodes TaxID=5353 RepID=A0A1Q3DUY1_LENED|nr:hypothetical protein LENED_000076 [Lentinula edodes]
MAAIAKIVFPSPPPTTNALTSQQRTQLLRSTKKLGRVLGITPQLIDIYPYYTPAESAEWLDDNDFYRPKRRGSMEQPILVTPAVSNFFPCFTLLAIFVIGFLNLHRRYLTQQRCQTTSSSRHDFPLLRRYNSGIYCFAYLIR